LPKLERLAQAHLLAKLLADGVRNERENFSRQDSDYAQTAVWLVGLASTLLAATVVDPTKVRSALGMAYGPVISCLWTTIVAGVTYRVVAHLLASNVLNRAVLLESRFVASVEAYTLKTPDLLSNRWTGEEIVARIHEQFDLDYSFLLKYDTSIEKYREIYLEQYNSFERHSNDFASEHLALYAAAHDLNNDEPSATADPEKLRSKAKLINSMSRAAMWLFLVCASAFVASMFLVAAAVAWR
jgi:hypothetical protein